MSTSTMTKLDASAARPEPLQKEVATHRRMPSIGCSLQIPVCRPAIGIELVAGYDTCFQANLR